MYQKVGANFENVLNFSDGSGAPTLCSVLVIHVSNLTRI
jgi:hypothetical protein